MNVLIFLQLLLPIICGQFGLQEGSKFWRVAEIYKGVDWHYRVRSYHKFKKFLSYYFKRITDSHIYCIFHATHHTNPSTMTTKKNYRVLGKPQGFKAQSNFIGTGLTNTLCLLFSSHENIHLFRLRPNRELGTLKTLGSWPNTYQIFRSPSEKQKKKWDFQIFGSLTVLLFIIPSIVSCVLCCFVWSCLYESSLPWRDLGITCFNLYMWHCLDL